MERIPDTSPLDHMSFISNTWKNISFVASACKKCSEVQIYMNIFFKIIHSIQEWRTKKTLRARAASRNQNLTPRVSGTEKVSFRG